MRVANPLQEIIDRLTAKRVRWYARKTFSVERPIAMRLSAPTIPVHCWVTDGTARIHRRKKRKQVVSVRDAQYLLIGVALLQPLVYVSTHTRPETLDHAVRSYQQLVGMLAHEPPIPATRTWDEILPRLAAIIHPSAPPLLLTA